MASISYISDIDQWREEFSFHISIRVRFSETDMNGHVNNVSAFIYFEEARIEFMKASGLLSDANENHMPVVADMQCDYHMQMYFDDVLNLYVKADHVGNTSVDIHYMALNQESSITLTGRGRLVQLDMKTGSPVPLSSTMKEKLLHGL